MEEIHVILIALLFVLAISDLIVGVSNDAVNFLNSTIGWHGHWINPSEYFNQLNVTGKLLYDHL